MKIAILGAEGTGKSCLTKALLDAFADSSANLLIADTTALMTAIENGLLTDTSRLALPALASYQNNIRDSNLTLVMGLDWPWVADADDPNGLNRRSRVDASLRQFLQSTKLNYVVIYGQGSARTERALQAIAHHAALPQQQQAKSTSSWQWACDKCSDAACEHRMFTGLLKLDSV